MSNVTVYDDRYHVVVTGHSSRVSQRQADTLRRLLEGIAEKHERFFLHHGMCVGADEKAHLIACDLGLPVIGHPGVSTIGESGRRARLDPDTFVLIYEPEEYLTRNGVMVRMADECIGLVHRTTWYRSGEWATINRARAKPIPTTLIPPTGLRL